MHVALLAVLSSALTLSCGGNLGADEKDKLQRSSNRDKAEDIDGGAAADDDARGSDDDPATQVDRDDDDTGPNADPDDEDPSADDPEDATDPSGDPDDPDATDPAPPDEDLIAPPLGESTRLARLTHSQYQNTIYELFGITDGPGRDFAPDSLNGFGFQTSVDFRVDARLGPQYRDAAEALAGRVVADAELLARVLPCADQSCAEQFVSSFGLKAFRRPLTDEEQTQFGALFARGAELVGSGDAFADGVRLVVEAMLQAPQFIYRTEFTADVDAEGKIVLGPYEVASRLAFFLFDAMPDQELFDRAAANELGTVEQVAEQVQRMLDDPRATRNLVAFHEQAWHSAATRRSRPTPRRSVNCRLIYPHGWGTLHRGSFKR